MNWPNNFCFAVKPRLRFLTAFTKSSKNPSKQCPSVRNNNIPVATFHGAKIATPIVRATIINAPPIVGVPALA